MRFALIGQPNCGKSTLFNQVAGFKAETGNFSGTTVTFTESKVRVKGKIIQLVDLPGTYTLAGSNAAERETIKYLLSNNVDGIIVVLDASRLSNGLDLALEILEFEFPTIIALNMVDESRRIGIKIDLKKFIERIGVPVIPLIASRGQGVIDVFTKAIFVVDNNIRPRRHKFSPEIEKYIHQLMEIDQKSNNILSKEGLAIKYLEWGTRQKLFLEDIQFEIIKIIESVRESINKQRGSEAVWIIGGERHAMSLKICQNVIYEGERKIYLRDRLDDLLLHPFWGYIFLVAILFIFFQVVYFFGQLLEYPLTRVFEVISQEIEKNISSSTLFASIIQGILQGISGGVSIVLPYLLPFLLGLGFLEDVGYLPRMAFLLDSFMHKLGLHGKAIVPFILGYGCNVPAIMSTRILEDDRDRFLAAALATMVPCGARLAVVFGLAANYLGPYLASLIYLLNLVVIALTAKILSRFLPEDSPGLILEIPVYRLPQLSNVTSKAWFRIKEFIMEAWPILIAGSIILAFLNYFDMSRYIDLIVRPITWVLGLPYKVGVPLIFGIFRKELSMVMLRQALNNIDISAEMTLNQILTYTVFIVFYIPCLATLIVIRKELGTKNMYRIMFMTITIAIFTALIARVLGNIIL